MHLYIYNICIYLFIYILLNIVDGTLLSAFKKMIESMTIYSNLCLVISPCSELSLMNLPSKESLLRFLYKVCP